MVGTRPTLFPRAFTLNEYDCISFISLIIRMAIDIDVRSACVCYLMIQKRATAQSIIAKTKAKIFRPRFRVKNSLSTFFLLFHWLLPGGKLAFRIITASVKKPSLPRPSFHQISAAFRALSQGRGGNALKLLEDMGTGLTLVVVGRHLDLLGFLFIFKERGLSIKGKASGKFLDVCNLMFD